MKNITHLNGAFLKSGHARLFLAGPRLPGNHQLDPGATPCCHGEGLAESVQSLGIGLAEQTLRVDRQQLVPSAQSAILWDDVTCNDIM